LHVIDISHPGFEEQMAAVEKILEELDLLRIPLLRVLNKADRLTPEAAERLSQALKGICISALHPETFAPLIDRVEMEIARLRNGSFEAAPSYDVPVESPIQQTA